MSMADRDAATMRVIEELKRIYKTKLMPLETLYRFDWFYQPIMTDAEFDSKPQVMLVGQYSVGKTSFIRYLLGRDFPGQRIGPEPTTDRFVAVMDGPDERIIPGNALAVSADLPYRGLERFGVSFLNKFEGSQLPSQVLRNITLIDTPGVLSGEKQRLARGYDFVNVCSWFASRADLIILLFDAHKLDISDEFKSVIESLKGQDDKIRCILNKADQVDRQRLMRVYGALLWSMGKVMKTPEVLRVYVGSFWDQPLQYEDNAALFEMEERDLMKDLRDLPRNSAVRKINELVKRVRLARVHAYVISYLKEQMPILMGKERKQQELLNDLSGVFRSVMKRYNLAPGDFPEMDYFRSKLVEMDFSKFAKLKPQLLEQVESVLSYDIPRLMEALPRSIHETSGASPGRDAPDGVYQEERMEPMMAEAIPQVPVHSRDWATPPLPSKVADAPPLPPPVVPPLPSVVEAAVAVSANPFGEDEEWDLAEYVARYEASFWENGPVEEKIDATVAKQVLLGTGLQKKTLRRIWEMSDMDRDGQLDLEEYVLAMYLAELVAGGQDLPETLPVSFVPPSKRCYL